MTYLNWKTRPVQIGHLTIGGGAPVCIQSMTISKTTDIQGTTEQIMRLVDAGCPLVRVTVQGIKEAQSCEAIKNTLIQKNIQVALVADIHFFPQAALFVVDFVDKVRINPGNFADKRATFKVIEYDDASYAKGLEHVKEKFIPLVEKCKKLKKALRIGTNHGSLSDRILNRYGDTPNGMVASAIEYGALCRDLDFHDLVFSMKSSNPKIMIAAYRKLVETMLEKGWDYPLHVGVTEAGSGVDGRVKSATGIGSLLLDGIGDTIRVSLTEDPWHEIDPAERIAKLKTDITFVLPEALIKKPSTPSFLHPDGTVVTTEKTQDCLQAEEAYGQGARAIHSLDPILLETLQLSPPSCIFLSPPSNYVPFCRQFFAWLKEKKLSIPVILHFRYDLPIEDLIIRAAAECGSLLCDGLGNGIWIDAPYSATTLKELSLHILQSARLRMSKTEFISCPGCGRTLFDLQEVSKRIEAKTSHLPGVKIAIMGCIVNGPGEMADADFGYVGSKPGMIDLYHGKTCVEKHIPFAEAEDRLIALIKKHGKWTDKLDQKL